MKAGLGGGEWLDVGLGKGKVTHWGPFQHYGFVIWFGTLGILAKFVKAETGS